MLRKQFRPRISPKRSAGPFFAASNAGRLELPTCDACGHVGHPGLTHCQQCLSDSFTWNAASGRGTVYSFIVMNRMLHSEFPGGYAVCVVELEEGPRFVVEVDVPPEKLQVGMPVTAVVTGYEAERPPMRFVASTPTNEESP